MHYKKKSDNKELVLNELEQYDRRQNLDFVITLNENKDVTQIILDRIEQSNVDITEKDISIAHRLHLKRGNANLKNRRHPPIIVRFPYRYTVKQKQNFCKEFQRRALFSNFRLLYQFYYTSSKTNSIAIHHHN